MTLQNSFAPSYWQRFRATIEAGQTNQSLAVQKSLTKSITYIVTISSATKTVKKTVSVTNENDALKSSVSNIVGGFVNVALNETIIGDNIVLEATNNESFPIAIEVYYITAS